mmetsp:Transcript_35993/g.64404  ORF Transcript_35993/g.64404 Transcript_35993/m.64404 type:complete len:249 (+) Transcript_35993:2217-2963(+)
MEHAMGVGRRVELEGLVLVTLGAAELGVADARVGPCTLPVPAAKVPMGAVVVGAAPTPPAPVTLTPLRVAGDAAAVATALVEVPSTPIGVHVYQGHRLLNPHEAVRGHRHPKGRGQLLGGRVLEHGLDLLSHLLQLRQVILSVEGVGVRGLLGLHCELDDRAACRDASDFDAALVHVEDAGDVHDELLSGQLKESVDLNLQPHRHLHEQLLDDGERQQLSTLQDEPQLPAELLVPVVAIWTGEGRGGL